MMPDTDEFAMPAVMTDDEFDCWMLAFDRLLAADEAGRTKLVRRYQPGPARSQPQADYRFDRARARQDNEDYGDNL